MYECYVSMVHAPLLQIDIVITTTSTLTSIPSLSARICNKFGMRTDTQNFSLGGHGECFGFGRVPVVTLHSCFGMIREGRGGVSVGQDSWNPCHRKRVRGCARTPVGHDSWNPIPQEKGVRMCSDCHGDWLRCSGSQASKILHRGQVLETKSFQSSIALCKGFHDSIGLCQVWSGHA
jgi:hypothetical protein